MDSKTSPTHAHTASTLYWVGVMIKFGYVVGGEDERI